MPLEAPVMRKTPSAIGGDECACELTGIERLQVVEGLPHTHELDRKPDLVRDRDRDPALRAAVELRESHARDLHRLAEEPSLLEPVLARRRIHDEQGLVGCTLEALGDDAPDL